MPRKILIISDDTLTSRLLKLLCMSRGLPVEEAKIDHHDAARDENRLLIYDIPLFPEKGERCRNMTGDSRRIIISADRKECAECDLMNEGVCFHFEKPFLTKEIVKKVEEFASLPKEGFGGELREAAL